jgi:hypothetical protein
MPELPEERVKLLKTTLPTLPILPIDLFSRGTDAQYDPFEHMQRLFAPSGLPHSESEGQYDPFNHKTPDEYIHNYPEILDLKVNAKSGVYDVVGLTNWRSSPTTRTLTFADKLGLSPAASYVVFDFWGQKVLGVVKGRMDVSIDPHDTRVFLIHPLLNRPQLVGTSRHITGAYSIKDLAWDGSKNWLRGSSETVAGEAYTLWVYVPKGAVVSRVQAGTKGSAAVPVQHELTENSLKVTFPGQPEVVDWEVEFTGHSSQ